MSKEYYEELIKRVLKKIEEEKRNLLNEQQEIKVNLEKAEKLVESFSKNHLSSTSFLEEISSSNIDDSEISMILKACIDKGIELPEHQYNNMISKIMPLLEEKLVSYKNMASEISQKIERYSNYSSLESIKNHMDDFEKDILSMQDIDSIETILALCLVSCDDFKINEKVDSVEPQIEEVAQKKSIEEEPEEFLIDKYGDFLDKKQKYEEKIKKPFEYQIKRYEEIDIYNSSLEYSPIFYKLQNELKIIHDNYLIDSPKLEELCNLITEHNVSQYYDEFINRFNLIKVALEGLKGKVDEYLKLYNELNKEDLIEEPKEQEIVEGIKEDVIEEPEELLYEEKVIDDIVTVENTNYLLERAQFVYNSISDMDAMKGYLVALEVLINNAKSNPSDKNMEDLKETIETIEKISGIQLEDRREEEIIDFEDLGKENIVLFCKDIETGEFCIESDLENLSLNKNIQNRTEKEVKGLIEKLTNVPYTKLKSQKSGKGVGNNFLKPIERDDGKWEGIKPYRAMKGDSRSWVAQLSVCDEIKEQIKEQLGYGENGELDQIIIMGGVLGEKKDKELRPLTQEIINNQTYIDFLNNVLSNPNTNIEEVMELINESIEVYSRINSSRSR